jgi:hypothetical protein
MFNKLNKLSELNYLTKIKENLKFKVLDSDENGREIWAFKLHDITFNEQSYYPNVRVHSAIDNEIYDPIDEEIMSLKKLKSKTHANFLTSKKNHNIYQEPLFYFIYNSDNYFHFVYDSLPYICTFNKLRKDYKNLKLLVAPSNFQRRDLYPFAYEFFKLLDIKIEDLVFVDSSTLYSTLFVSNSYTHSEKSDVAPRKEIYDLYNEIKFAAQLSYKNFDTAKKFYVSRRTWRHNNLSNIGTNYTQRRILKNEDSLVDFLSSKGYYELFCENMTIVEKISFFSNAEKIVGSSGGGLVNALFSSDKTSLAVINSPLFDLINRRFRFSYNNVNVSYFDCTKHVDSDFFKKYMRVEVPSLNIVGEIIDKINDQLLISFSDTRLAGWNSDLTLSKIQVDRSLCIPLDGGLNSPWEIDILKFKEFFHNFDYA